MSNQSKINLTAFSSMWGYSTINGNYHRVHLFRDKHISWANVTDAYIFFFIWWWTFIEKSITNYLTFSHYDYYYHTARFFGKKIFDNFRKDTIMRQKWFNFGHLGSITILIYFNFDIWNLLLGCIIMYIKLI